MIIHYVCILIITSLFPLQGIEFVTLPQKTSSKARTSSAKRSAQRKTPCEKMEYEPSREPPRPPSAEAESSIPTDLARKTTQELERAIRKCVEPAYPPLAKVARVGGEVKVDIVIDEEGNVVLARAVSGHPLLKEAAEQAAKKWKFKPIVVEGNPSKVVGTIKMNFRE